VGAGTGGGACPAWLLELWVAVSPGVNFTNCRQRHTNNHSHTHVHLRRDPLLLLLFLPTDNDVEEVCWRRW